MDYKFQIFAVQLRAYVKLAFNFLVINYVTSD